MKLRLLSIFFLASVLVVGCKPTAEIGTADNSNARKKVRNAEGKRVYQKQDLSTTPETRTEAEGGPQQHNILEKKDNEEN